LENEQPTAAVISAVARPTRIHRRFMAAL
jgi:hypothetical protein